MYCKKCNYYFPYFTGNGTMNKVCPSCKNAENVLTSSKKDYWEWKERTTKPMVAIAEVE